MKEVKILLIVENGYIVSGAFGVAQEFVVGASAQKNIQQL